MGFGIRRNRSIRPFAARGQRWAAHVAREEDEWDGFRYSRGGGADHFSDRDKPVEEHEMTAPMSAPTKPLPNGFRAQLTGNDMRAERLVRDVRAEVADLREAFAALGTARDGMLEIDLDAVAANPEAAATLPPASLVGALLSAARRIQELEQEVFAHEREQHGLRDRLASLQDDYSYTRGRLETLHEVIAALHGNLEDFRYERDRRRLPDTPAPRALRSGDPDDPPFGMQGQHGGGTLR